MLKNLHDLNISENANLGSEELLFSSKVLPFDSSISCFCDVSKDLMDVDQVLLELECLADSKGYSQNTRFFTKVEVALELTFGCSSLCSSYVYNLPVISFVVLLMVVWRWLFPRVFVFWILFAY